MGFESIVNKTHIDEQYDQLINIIKETFGEDSERTNHLLKMYEDFEDRVKTAPASGKLNFHNAYEGGYLDHVLNVLRCARLIKRLYAHIGGWIDFTDEELVMAALHHDLGKLGTLDHPYYLVQDSDWHRKNKLEVFKHNENAQYMPVTDRALYLLQSYDVNLTQTEFLAIKLSDGMYDKANESYLRQYGAGPFPMRNNLCSILHWADHMAALQECDEVRKKMTR